MARKMMALLLALTLLASSAAFAAEWPQGLGPEKPYPQVAPVDLDKIMGYYVAYPGEKVTAQKFCDRLEIYLPREDVSLGKGYLHLFASEPGRDGVEVETIDFSDTEAVKLRKLTDMELNTLQWGGGMAVTMYLKKSLEMGMQYYIMMDQGVITANGGSVINVEIDNTENEKGRKKWIPVFTGEYGVNNLRYSQTLTPAEPDPAPVQVAPEPAQAAPAAGSDAFGGADVFSGGNDLGGFGSNMGGSFADTVTVDDGMYAGVQNNGGFNDFAAQQPAAQAPVAEAPAADSASTGTVTAAPVEEGPLKLTPAVGDTIVLDIVLGGRAKKAVIYSENNSVRFLNNTVTASCTISGTVAAPDLKWSVLFLDDMGNAFDSVNIVR